MVLDSTLLLCCNTGGLSIQSNLWSSAFRELRHHADTEFVQSGPSLVSVRHVQLARASALCHLDSELSLIVLFRPCFVSHSSRPSFARPSCFACLLCIHRFEAWQPFCCACAVHLQTHVIMSVCQQSCTHCLHESSKLSAVIATCPITCWSITLRISSMSWQSTLIRCSCHASLGHLHLGAFTQHL